MFSQYVLPNFANSGVQMSISIFAMEKYNANVLPLYSLLIYSHGGEKKSFDLPVMGIPIV